MKEKMTNNLSLKIFAVLFAATLWLISININDPYQSKEYSVVVQLQNVSTMTTGQLTKLTICSGSCVRKISITKFLIGSIINAIKQISGLNLLST